MRFVSWLLLGTAASPAWSQVIPSDRVETDQNGVNLLNLDFRYLRTDVSVGPKEAPLEFVKYYSGVTGYSSDNSMYYLNGDPFIFGSSSLSVIGGGTSNKFNCSSNGITMSCSSANGNGAQLVLTSADGDGNYTYDYISRDGTRIHFSNFPRNYVMGNYVNALALATGKTLSDGTIITYNWQRTSYTINSRTLTLFRVSRMSDTRGYAVVFQYQRDSGVNSSNATEYIRMIKASGINSFSCVTNSTGCSSSTMPSMSYTWGGTPSAPSLTTLDGAGRTTVFNYGYGGITGIVRDGHSSPDISISYVSNTTGMQFSPNYFVESFTKGGKTWLYSLTKNSGDVTTTVTKPDNSQVVAKSTSIPPVRLASYRDEKMNVTSYFYDGNNRLSMMVAPEGNKVSFLYDGRGNIKESKQISKTPGNPVDIVTKADFDLSCANVVKCNQPNWTEDALGRRTDYGYSATSGLLTSITRPASPDGVRPQTRMEYTPLSASQTIGGTLYQASPIQILTAVSECRSGSNCGSSIEEVRKAYNYSTGGSYNNLTMTSASTGNGAGSMATTSYGYDLVGNQTSIDGPIPGSVDTTKYKYDLVRQVVGAVYADPDGTEALKPLARKISYNGIGQVTADQFGTVDNASDLDLTSFDPAQTVQNSYENDNLSRRVARSGGLSGAIFGIADYKYDSLDRLTCSAVRMNSDVWATVKDACAAQTAGSNGADRIIQSTYDATGRVETVTSGYGTSDASVETSSYTPNGLVATMKDGRNNLTTYEYDGFDRLRKTRYPVATVGANASSTSDYEELTPDANGNILTRRLRDGGTITYTYDNLNRLTSMAPGGEATVSYQYDLLGRPTQVSGSSVVNYGWDALGRLTSDGQPYGTVSYQYDPDFKWKKIIWPDGFFAKYDLDYAGNVTAIHSNSDSGNIIASYGYDSLGRRTTTSFGNGTSKTYAYDAASRLAGMKLDVMGTNYDLVIGEVNGEGTPIGYNNASQIKQIRRSNDRYSWSQHEHGQRDYTSNGLNQYGTMVSTPPYGAASTTSYGYDGRGNLTSDGAASYTYNKLNQLLTAPGVTFGYDPTGRLSQQVAGPVTTRFIHNQAGMMLAELDTSNAITQRFIPGPGTDEPILWYEGAGTGNPNYLMADERGSITTVTNDVGNIVRPNNYDEYGNPDPLNSGRFLYTGQAYLREAKLYYYKARMYSPTLGRFLQTDPIGYADGINWYAYTGNDPVNKTDPMGLADNAIKNGEISDGTPESIIEGNVCKASLWKCSPASWFMTMQTGGGNTRARTSPARSPNGEQPGVTIDNSCNGVRDLLTPDVQSAALKALEKSLSNNKTPTGKAEWGLWVSRGLFGGINAGNLFGGKSRFSLPNSEIAREKPFFGGALVIHAHPNGKPPSRVSVGPEGDEGAAAEMGVPYAAIDQAGTITCTR